MISQRNLGFKIMMPPEVVNDVADALSPKQELLDIVRKSVRTRLDEHYFAVMMHRGISDDLQPMSFSEIAKILSRRTPAVHHLIAQHMISGSARGGCKFCNGASKELKMVIAEQRTRVTPMLTQFA
jgi:hypothetical protein